uniref:ATP synthase complex subunit 8 n=1 Tax=Neoperla coffea TaxID=3049213 RepID=A0AA95Z7V6_9NEOP|nr:ATPase subunit 8 [Neoperla coffea]
MPQMAPISWFLLFLIFSGTLLMFNFLTYFSFLPPAPTTDPQQATKLNPLTWKW